MTAVAAAPMTFLRLLHQSHLRAADVYGDPGVLVKGIATNASEVKPGDLFVAQAGTRVDSHKLIPEAFRNGAVAFLVEREVPDLSGIPHARVPSTRFAVGPLAQAMYGNPAANMTILGCTGTNGKTSTATLCAAILQHAGIQAGRIGTLGNFWCGKETAAVNTTPGPLELARLLAQMRADGVQAVAMEVSSHAIDQGRVCGVPFRAGALTSISQDHLDYHGDYPSYIACKKRFFTDHVYPSAGLSVLNLDDSVGEEFSAHFLGEWIGFSRNGDRPADIRAEDVAVGPSATSFTLCIRGRRAKVTSSLVGSFNVTNMLAAAGLALAAGIDVETIAGALSQAPPIPGRFERIECGQAFTVIVDYAHTPDALERVLRTARRITLGKLHTVFGCGGDRDRGKRPLMGRVVGELSDYAIVTSDNPRSEDPDAIARHVVEGVLQGGMKSPRFQTILDRRAAIAAGLRLASAGDVVLIAGKGHETYQEVAGKRHAFDDREVVRELIANDAYRTPIVSEPIDPTADRVDQRRGEG